MKRFKILMMALLATSCIFSFTSCEKDGVYNPDKKISAIYMVDDNGKKELFQTWTWDKKLLTSITTSISNVSQTMNLSYNKSKQLTCIQLDNNNRSDIEYDGKQLTQMIVYTDGEASAVYRFTHNSDKKISGYTVEANDSDFGMRSANLVNTAFLFIAPEIAEAETQHFVAAATSEAKSAQKYEVTLTYTDDNVTEMVIKKADGTETRTYTYNESKLNPFYKFLAYSENDTYSFSKNCPTHCDIKYTNSDRTKEIKYNYTFDGKYPIQDNRDHVTHLLGTSFTTHERYVYEYSK